MIDMKRSQKGVTLVEIIVAIAVFSIISLALFSSVFAMKNVVARQEEYVKLEMVCYDISAYYDYVEDGEIIYLTSDFKRTNSDKEASYKISIKVIEDKKLLTITNIDENITFVENVQLPITNDKGGENNDR